jgi:hypothetical protein
MLWLEFICILLKEVRRLLRMRARDVVEGIGRDVIRLAYPYQTIVLEEILDLRGGTVGLGLGDFLRFGSVCVTGLLSFMNSSLGDR